MAVFIKNTVGAEPGNHETHLPPTCAHNPNEPGKNSYEPNPHPRARRIQLYEWLMDLGHMLTQDNRIRHQILIDLKMPSRTWLHRSPMLSASTRRLASMQHHMIPHLDP